MDTLHIEPAHEQRPHFALWCLEQVPPIQTASASGFDVPTDLYPDIPTELLHGAYVDGYRLDRAQPQPEVPQAAQAPVAPRKAPVRKPRKRASRKTSVTVVRDVLGAVSAPTSPAQDDAVTVAVLGGSE